MKINTEEEARAAVDAVVEYLKKFDEQQREHFRMRFNWVAESEAADLARKWCDEILTAGRCQPVDEKTCRMCGQ